MWQIGSSKGNDMARKSESAFEDGDFVVYPTHGVGCVIDIEKREVVGQNLEMYVIEFIRDKLVLRVPVEKAKALNLRKVSKPSKIQTVMKILAQKARIKRTMWSRRAQEYDQKINSGDIEQIAEVVRDLNRANNQIEQSYSERQLSLTIRLFNLVICSIQISHNFCDLFNITRVYFLIVLLSSSTPHCSLNPCFLRKYFHDSLYL